MNFPPSVSFVAAAAHTFFTILSFSIPSFFTHLLLLSAASYCLASILTSLHKSAPVSSSPPLPLLSLPLSSTLTLVLILTLSPPSLYSCCVSAVAVSPRSLCSPGSPSLSVALAGSYGNTHTYTYLINQQQSIIQMTYSVRLDSQVFINMLNSSAAPVDPCCHD